MTGIASGKVLTLDLREAAKIVKEANKYYAEIIGINPAARTTLVKPSGTTSLVLGCSSGIHAWHWNYFLRTIRFNKTEDIASYLMVNHPELCEDDQLRTDVLCARVPMKAPDTGILRTESAIDLLERVKKFSEEWIKPGHRDGINTHNVSATISIDKNKGYMYLIGEYEFADIKLSADRLQYIGEVDKHCINEWQAVGQWMWENKDIYNGLSVLPYDGGSYVQAPFENCTKEEFEKRYASLTDIDLTKIQEVEDNTAFTQDSACMNGKCEINVA